MNPPPIELPPTVISTREFHPDAVYRINVDNDGDALADVAFTFTFSARQGGAQIGTAYHATGAQAREPGPAWQRPAPPAATSIAQSRSRERT